MRHWERLMASKDIPLDGVDTRALREITQHPKFKRLGLATQTMC
jgi:hypothetical protein